jgi:hypothetical protein
MENVKAQKAYAPVFLNLKKDAIIGYRKQETANLLGTIITPEVLYNITTTFLILLI